MCVLSSSTEGVEVVTHSAVVGAKFNGARVELSTSQGDAVSCVSSRSNDNAFPTYHPSCSCKLAADPSKKVLPFIHVMHRGC